MFHWMGSAGRTGCTFAAALSRDRYRTDWFPLELADVSHLDFFTRVVAPHVAAEAVMVVFPGLKGDRGLLDLVLAMERTDGWDVQQVPKLCEHAPAGTRPVSVRLHMPWVSEDAWAEVLGLGTGTCMPPTRCSPQIAFSYRSGGKTGAMPTGARPEINLCDIPIRNMTQQRFDDMKQKTGPFRTRALNGYPSGLAKAQLSFAIPRRMADEEMASV